MRNTDLTGANLSGANLRYSNFDGVIITSTDFTNANYDSHTLDTFSDDAKLILKNKVNCGKIVSLLSINRLKFKII